MDQYLSLVGAVVGWVLGQFGWWIAGSRADRRALGKVVSALLSLLDDIAVRSAMFESALKQDQEAREFLHTMMAERVSQTSRKIDFEELLSDVAGFEPVLASKIGSIAQLHKFGMDITLKTTVKVPVLYERIARAHLMSFQIERELLERAAKRLAWKQGVLVWISTRWHIRKMAKPKANRDSRIGTVVAELKMIQGMLLNPSVAPDATKDQKK